MRRRVSLAALCFAWLCANGVIWNGVQVVAWAKMIHDYSQVMPLARALKVTFDGSAPCDLCVITTKARDAEHDQLPAAAALGASERFVLALHTVAPFVPTPPDSPWPSLGDLSGSGRSDPVPVPPPRAGFVV